MNNEYVIINKTEWLKVMEEWENKYGNEDSPSSSEANILLKQTLSKSTPLIPEIEMAYNEGMLFGTSTLLKRKSKQDYISNLKLDI